MLGYIREESQMASSLNGQRQDTLMFSAGAGGAARLNLTPIRYKAAQFSRVFIAYIFNMVDAKNTNLSPGNVSPPIPSPRFKSTLLICSCSLVHLVSISCHYSNGKSSGSTSTVPPSSFFSSGRAAEACLSRKVTRLAITSVRLRF